MMIKKKFEFILSLAAGLVMLIACVINNTPLMDMAVRILVTLVVFLIIGVIVKWSVLEKAFPDPVFEDFDFDGIEPIEPQEIGTDGEETAANADANNNEI